MIRRILLVAGALVLVAHAASGAIEDTVERVLTLDFLVQRENVIVVAPHGLGKIGYIPIDRQGANLLFQFVSRRYERGAIILISNQSLGARGEVFGDPVIATRHPRPPAAPLITVNVHGDSYRLKEKMKAGLLKSKIAAAVAAD